METDISEISGPDNRPESPMPQISIRQPYPSLVLNAISNWGPLGVNMIIGFILTPLLIAHLGTGDYGIWILVGSFLGYYGLLRLGVSSGIMRYVPFYTGRDDLRSTSAIISTGLAIFLLVGLVIFVVSMLAAQPIARFYKAGPELAALVRILGVAAAIECPMRILDATVRARERWVVANSVAILSAIMRASGLVGCVYLGYGLVEMGYVVLAVTIFSMILTVYIFIKVCPMVHIGPVIVGLSHARALISFGLLSTIVTLAWTLTLQGHSLIIGKLISLEAVAIYAVAAFIVRNVRYTIVAPNRVLWPRFAHLDGENKHKEIASLFRRATQYNAIFASGIILIVFVAGPDFIRFWVGEGFEAVYAALKILALGYLIETSLTAGGFLLGGTGRQGINALFAATEGVLGIGLSICLGWKMGLAGIALGFTISVCLVRGLVCPWYICRLLNISYLRYYLSNLARPWLVLLSLLLATYYAELTSLVSGWLSLTLMVFGLSCLYAICAYFVALDTCARGKIKNLVQKSWNYLRLLCTATGG